MIDTKKPLFAAMLLWVLVGCGTETMQTSAPATGSGGTPAASAAPAASVQGPYPGVMAAFSDLRVTNRKTGQGINPGWERREASFGSSGYVITEISVSNRFWAIDVMNRIKSPDSVKEAMTSAMTSRGYSNIQIFRTLPITHPTALAFGNIAEGRAINSSGRPVNCVYVQSGFAGARPPGDTSEVQWSPSFQSSMRVLLCDTRDTSETMLRRIQSIQTLRS